MGALVNVAVAVLEFEDLLVHHIVHGLMGLGLEGSLDEVVLLELELAFSSNSLIVKLVLNIGIFWVSLEVCLVVISVHLLLLC